LAALLRTAVGGRFVVGDAQRDDAVALRAQHRWRGPGAAHVPGLRRGARDLLRARRIDHELGLQARFGPPVLFRGDVDGQRPVGDLVADLDGRGRLGRRGRIDQQRAQRRQAQAQDATGDFRHALSPVWRIPVCMRELPRHSPDGRLGSVPELILESAYKE
jgi:hypothetical protein